MTALLALLALYPPAGPLPLADQDRVVQGTKPLAGDEVKVGQTVTLGDPKRDAVNVTVRSVGYSIDAFRHGARVYATRGDSKWVVVRYTLQNPLPKDLQVNWSTLAWTLVDAEDTNFETPNEAFVESSGAPLTQDLKPGQKIDVVRYFLVGAKSQIAKLIVRPASGKVARVPLSTAITALPEAFAEPGQGHVALETVPAEFGRAYPAGSYTVTVDSVAYSGPKYGRDRTANPGESVLTVQMKVATNADPDRTSQPVSGVRLEVIDEDGQRVRDTGTPWGGRDDRPFSGSLPSDRTPVGLRYQIVVPNSTRPGALAVWDDLVSPPRRYLFSLAGVTPPGSTTPDTEFLSMTVSPQPTAMRPGQSQVFKATLTPLGGYAGTVEVSAVRIFVGRILGEERQPVELDEVLVTQIGGLFGRKFGSRPTLLAGRHRVAITDPATGSATEGTVRLNLTGPVELTFVVDLTQLSGGQLLGASQSFGLMAIDPSTGQRRVALVRLVP